MQNVINDESQSKKSDSTLHCISCSTYVNLLTSSKAVIMKPVTVTSSQLHSRPTKLTRPPRSTTAESSPFTCFTPSRTTLIGSPMSSSAATESSHISLRLPPCSSSDDDMSVNSPDSGFESTSPANGGTLADIYDNFKADDCIDDFSKSSSSSSSFASSDRLCLVPPPKPDLRNPIKENEPPTFVCKWKDCNADFATSDELHSHINSVHVERATRRYSCLWEKCRVYDKPARNLSWLQRHVSVHTGKKQFKCVLNGCDASFSSQQGLARHVPSHFSEVGIPKARLPGCNERRYLVKRRRIQDEKKALANVHDQLDPRSLDLIVHSLVLLHPHSPSTSRSPSPNDQQVVCKRRCEDGSVWVLRDNSWCRSHVTTSANREAPLFFARPTKRARKAKVSASATQAGI